MKTIRILLADDHTILRKGLQQIIADELPQVRFGEANDAAEALELLNASAWDLLILDINMPGRNGFEVLEEVSRHHPGTAVLVLSSTPEDQLGVRAMRCGASGYLNKQTAPEKLVEAVETLLRGEQYISPTLAARLVADLRRNAGGPRHELLSDRELQVCVLCGDGKSIKEIAAELCLSPKTISTFRSRVFEKLGVRNDVELANYVREHQLAVR